MTNLTPSFSDANGDANRGSDPVGCCRSARRVCIQEAAPDGSCRVMGAFWKCGRWCKLPRGFESLSLRQILYGIRDMVIHCKHDPDRRKRS
jgi:hypothetical protein